MALRLVFKLTQHIRDEELMSSLIHYFDCGYISKYKDACDYKVIKFSDVQEKIIPFFNNYSILALGLGVKSKDFEDFNAVALIMKEKGHLTSDGWNQIQKIKAGMNKRRI